MLHQEHFTCTLQGEETQGWKELGCFTHLLERVGVPSTTGHVIAESLCKTQEKKVRPDTSPQLCSMALLHLKLDGTLRKFHSELGTVHHINPRQDISLGQVQLQYSKDTPMNFQIRLSLCSANNIICFQAWRHSCAPLQSNQPGSLMSPLQHYSNCQHTRITNTRLSSAILNKVIKAGSSERLDHPNTFRLFLKHLQFLFRRIWACQLSKIKGGVGMVKTTNALKHTNPLHFPSTNILFNLLSVTFSNAYSRLHSHSDESQLRNQ